MDVKLNVKVALVQDKVGIVTIAGELSVFIQEFDLLYKEVMAYTKMGIYRFILDFTKVTYIDSSGIGILMRLATNASKQSSMICVICDHPQILKIMAVSNVDKIVRYVPSVDDGLNYYLMQ